MFEIGYRADGLPLNIPLRHWRTHAAIFGMTGSGKTGLGIVILEEALINDVPVVAFDVKGDIANLALRRSSEGRASRLADKEVLILTPGSSAGLPISISGLLSMPESLSWESHEEILLEKINTISDAILGLVYKGKRDLEREKSFLAALIEYAWRNGEPLDLEKLVTYILEPPFRKIGVLQLENFLPLKERKRLAVAVNKLLSLPSFKMWRRGVSPDFNKLLWNRGEPRGVVVYMAHLNEEQRMFTATLLLQQVYGWMFERGASENLRALLFFDEIYGYLPPYPKNPPTKHLLMLLFKQARAFGLGLVISTQNPVDVDYKVLSNAGLWFVGKLKTANDRRRLLEGMGQESSFYERSLLEGEIASLAPREFILVNSRDKEIVKFRTRDAYSELRGPMTLEDIRRITGGAKEGVPIIEVTHTPPMIPEELPSYYLPVKAGGRCRGGVYKPLIYVRIYAKAYNRKYKIEKTVSASRFLIPQPLVKLSSLVSSAYCISAEQLDVEKLSSKWMGTLRFDALPPEYMRKGIYRKLERKVKLLLSTGVNGGISFFIHRGTGMISEIGEPLEDFVSRVEDELLRRAEQEKKRILSDYEVQEKLLRERLNSVRAEAVRVRMRIEELSSFASRLRSLFSGSDRERVKGELIVRLTELTEKAKRISSRLEELERERDEKLMLLESAVKSESRNVEEVPLRLKKNSINIELFLIWVPVVEERGVYYNCFTGERCVEE